MRIMEKVRSSNISEIGYDVAKNSLYVRFFSGALYEYFDVPFDVYESFKSAYSVGAFFHSSVRKNYAYTRIND